jgi:5-hydroxyisourate hydrolase
MSQLTTHILDTSTGKPAAGIAVTLERNLTGSWKKIAHGITNSEGRISDMLMSGSFLENGIYRLVFETGSYFKSQDKKTFYPQVAVEFEVTDHSHYHVPLILNPYGYTTYRGS